MSETATTFGFSVDHKEAGGFEPLPAGKYEVIIQEVEVKEGENCFNSGSTGLKVRLVVRNDVVQEGAKRIIFDQLVAVSAAMFKFQQYSKAVGLPEGTNITSLQEFKKQIMYKPMSVTLGIKSYVNNDGERIYNNEVKGCDIPNTAYAGGAASGDPFAADGKPIDISDDDLPF